MTTNWIQFEEEEEKKGGGSKHQFGSTASEIYQQQLSMVPTFHLGTTELSPFGCASVPLCGSGVHDPSIIVQPERVFFLHSQPSGSKLFSHNCFGYVTECVYSREEEDIRIEDVEVGLRDIDLETIASFENRLESAVKSYKPGQSLIPLVDRDRKVMRCGMTRRDKRMLELWHNQLFFDVIHFRLEWSWLYFDSSEDDILSFTDNEHLVCVGIPRAIPLCPATIPLLGGLEQHYRQEQEIKMKEGVRKRKVTSTRVVKSGPSKRMKTRNTPKPESHISSTPTTTKTSTVVKTKPAMKRKKKKNTRKTYKKKKSVDTIRLALGDDPNGDIFVDIIGDDSTKLSADSMQANDGSNE